MLPHPEHPESVGMMAQQQGLARLTLNADDLYRKACDMISRSRDLTQWMMQRGFIAEAPE